MKTKLLYYLLVVILTGACRKNETQLPSFKLISTPSRVETVHEPDTTWNGEFCAAVSVNDPAAMTAIKENLIIEVARGYLVAIRKEDKTVIKDFQAVFFDDEGYTGFRTNGLEYRVLILASLKECYSGALKEFSFQCNGKTQKRTRCKNKTLDASRLCWRHRE